MAKKRRKKYTFKPNRNTWVTLIVFIFIIWIITRIAACSRYDRSLRGAEYTYEPVNLPEFQVRACVGVDGTPTADYFKIYPPEEGEKVIYLTFDDGPSTKITPKILDVLKKNNVCATFFIIGQNAEKNPDMVRRIAEEGHAVANHTYSHNYSNLYTDTDGFREEILKAKEILINIAGKENYTDIIRFPGGAFRDERAEFKEILIEENIAYVNWNCATGDSETKNPAPADLLSNAKKTAKSSGADFLVLLMHDSAGKQASVDALSGIIKHFRDEGYEFKTLKRY